MTRVYHTFEVEDINLIKQQMLTWSNQFSICCFLDNQQYSSNYNSFECLIGVGCVSAFKPDCAFFPSLNKFLNSNTDWIFGHFNFETNNCIEGLISPLNPDQNCFPDCFLFVPETVLFLIDNTLSIGLLSGDAASIYADIVKEAPPLDRNYVVDISNRISRQEYLETVGKLQEHIHHGDCYEINYCQEFYANAEVDPALVYAQLIKRSPNPFSAFYRLHNNYLLSASPERYIKKIGEKLISQPIKGTSARKAVNSAEDEISKKQLKDSAKEQAENVMIVDLVRNDLSKICEEGTVKVEELFGVYSFPNVHQMISTVTGYLKDDKTFCDVLKATFPMGSMTGAPKKKVIELIEKYEAGKRGIYSGTVGYISPEKDFDFNVVIRSIVYNSTSKSISFYAGSAITASSKPEQEYEECLLKAKGILKVFSEE